MLKAVLDGKGYPWPCGVYVDSESAGFRNCLMAMETRVDREGVHWEMPRGSEAELADLRASYEHLTKLRDEVIAMGLLPPTEQWSDVNPKL